MNISTDLFPTIFFALCFAMLFIRNLGLFLCLLQSCDFYFDNPKEANERGFNFEPLKVRALLLLFFCVSLQSGEEHVSHGSSSRAHDRVDSTNERAPRNVACQIPCPVICLLSYLFVSLFLSCKHFITTVRKFLSWSIRPDIRSSFYFCVAICYKFVSQQLQ